MGTVPTDYVFQYGGNAKNMHNAPKTRYEFIQKNMIPMHAYEVAGGDRLKWLAGILRATHNDKLVQRYADAAVLSDQLMTANNKRNSELPESYTYEQRMADPEMGRIRAQRDSVNAELNKLFTESGKVRDAYLTLMQDVAEEKEAGKSLAGVLKTRMPSYALSALGLGALGRLIAGKKHAAWGWGGGIAAGLLANYLRRKSYYGSNISF